MLGNLPQSGMVNVNENSTPAQATPNWTKSDYLPLLAPLRSSISITFSEADFNRFTYWKKQKTNLSAVT